WGGLPALHDLFGRPVPGVTIDDLLNSFLKSPYPSATRFNPIPNFPDQPVTSQIGIVAAQSGSLASPYTGSDSLGLLNSPDVGNAADAGSAGSLIRQLGRPAGQFDPLRDLLGGSQYGGGGSGPGFGNVLPLFGTGFPNQSQIQNQSIAAI